MPLKKPNRRLEHIATKHGRPNIAEEIVASFKGSLAKGNSAPTIEDFQKWIPANYPKYADDYKELWGLMKDSD